MVQLKDLDELAQHKEEMELLTTVTDTKRRKAIPKLRPAAPNIDLSHHIAASC